MFWKVQSEVLKFVLALKLPPFVPYPHSCQNHCCLVFLPDLTLDYHKDLITVDF